MRRLFLGMLITWFAIHVVAGLVFGAWLATEALDDRFQATRFRAEGISDGCPIAVYRETALPMCTPLSPGW